VVHLGPPAASRFSGNEHHNTRHRRILPHGGSVLCLWIRQVLATFLLSFLLRPPSAFAHVHLRVTGHICVDVFIISLTLYQCAGLRIVADGPVLQHAAGL
jgi:hypothetical protein